MKPISSIRLYENNPRVNDRAVDTVVVSVGEFGFRQPIVVDEDGVIIVVHFTGTVLVLQVGFDEATWPKSENVALSFPAGSLEWYCLEITEHHLKREPGDLRTVREFSGSRFFFARGHPVKKHITMSLQRSWCRWSMGRPHVPPSTRPGAEALFRFSVSRHILAVAGDSGDEPIFEGRNMLVEQRPIGSIKPYQNNPRVNAHAVGAVAASIQEFGFRQPIVVDQEGVVIVGHTRYQAALQLGLTEVPVHVAIGLSPAQAKAYRLADNQTASLSQWDNERLPIELAELQKMDFNLNLTGFSGDELLKLLEPSTPLGETNPDDVPEPPDQATTQTGDLWVLGNHRLLCGDSSKPQDVDRLLGGQPIHLVSTDPPYNVKVEPRSNNAIAAGLSSFPVDARPHYHGFDLARDKQKGKATHKKLRAKDRPLANDFVTDEAFDRLLDAWFGNLARVLLPGRGFYIWGGYANCGNYPPVLKAKGLYFSQAIIWVKEHPVLTRKDFMGNHEWCFYGWREGAAHQYFGPHNATDVWPIKKINPQSMIHLTEKPAELARRAMEYSSKRSENVLDLFGGSGSTLIAAEQTGRRAFLMELDALYCDVSVQRWEQFTGKKAERLAAAA